MGERRIDALARAFATGTSRRRVLKSLAAGAAGGVGALAGGYSPSALAARLAETDPEEQSVLIYEAIASIAESHTGTCDEISAIAMQFRDSHGDLLDQIRTEQDSWTYAQRMIHNQKYGDRLDLATKTLHAATARCGYRSAPSDPANPPATPNAKTAAKSVPMRQDGCDCNANCPIGAGWCAYYWLSCVGGSESCLCCWTSYCGSYDHCMTDCQSNECCTGSAVCSSPVQPNE